MANSSRRFDTWTTIWLSLGALWGIGLVAAGLLVSSYSVTGSSGQGLVDEPGRTLVQVNGVKVLYVLLIPLACVAIVTIALLRRRQKQRPGVGVLVWVVAGLLGILVVLGAFTVGPFMAPVAIFVVLAALHERDRPDNGPKVSTTSYM